MAEDVAPAEVEDLTEDLPSDGHHLRLLMAAARDLYGAVDPEERMRLAVDRAIELTRAGRGILLRGEGDELIPCVARDAEGNDLDLNAPYTTTAVRAVWPAGDLFRATIDTIDPPQSMIKLALYSSMAARLVYAGRPLGVLYLDAYTGSSRQQHFSEQEERMFRVIAGLIAAALENSRLVQEWAHKERLEGALRYAGEAQAALLPPPEEVSAPEGIEIAALWRPCLDLSADYYDVIPRPDGRLAIAIGDVSGHAIPVVHHMFTARALIRSRQEENVHPSALVPYLNTWFRRDMAQDVFMSLFLGVLDPKSRQLEYASAGHNWPLLFRADGALEELQGTGPVLGAFDDAAYSLAEPVALASGDVLFLFTDGIFEAQGPVAGERYGEERLRASFLRHAASGGSAREIVAGLAADLDAWRGDCAASDDTTGLVLRVC